MLEKSENKPSLTDIELQFIETFINFTAESVLKAAGVPTHNNLEIISLKEAESYGRVHCILEGKTVYSSLNYLSDMYSPTKVGIDDLYEDLINSFSQVSCRDRILSFQTLESLLKISLYFRKNGIENPNITNPYFNIKNHDQLNALIRNLTETYKYALMSCIENKILKRIDLERILNFGRFLEEFCHDCISKSIELFKQNSDLKQVLEPVKSVTLLDDFKNDIKKILQSNFNQRLNETDKKEELKKWTEYLKVDNIPKLIGGYGRQEKLILGSKIYEFADIKAAFKKLSTTQKGKDLKARFKAYADMYQKGAVYKYHDEYIKAENQANIQKKVSKSISSNAEFSKFIPILLKEFEN
jgi:hypothetical protein